MKSVFSPIYDCLEVLATLHELIIRIAGNTQHIALLSVNSVIISNYLEFNSYFSLSMKVNYAKPHVMCHLMFPLEGLTFITKTLFKSFLLFERHLCCLQPIENSVSANEVPNCVTVKR